MYMYFSIAPCGEDGSSLRRLFYYVTYKLSLCDGRRSRNSLVEDLIWVARVDSDFRCFSRISIWLATGKSKIFDGKVGLLKPVFSTFIVKWDFVGSRSASWNNDVLTILCSLQYCNQTTEKHINNKQIGALQTDVWYVQIISAINQYAWALGMYHTYKSPVKKSYTPSCSNMTCYEALWPVMNHYDMLWIIMICYE